MIEQRYVVWDDTIETNEHGARQSRIDGRYDLLPPIAIAQIATVLKQGHDKYGDGNWQKIAKTDHVNHALAHIFKYLEFDADDAEHHLAHAATRLLFALEVDL